eukprot:39898_1
MAASDDTDSELQKHLQDLQQELEDLKDQYQVSVQNEKVISLEKNEIAMELDRLKEENSDLACSNEQLQSIQDTMQMERTHVLGPTLMDLESSHHEKSQLKSELKENKQNMKKLNTENIKIKQENEQYKLGLEQIDGQLRRKEIDSQHNIKILHKNIAELKHENEELNKKLTKYEMDLDSFQRQDEEEKVPFQLLNHYAGGEIEINVIDVEEDDHGSIASDIPQTPNLDYGPLILNKPSIISSRKRSIVLSFNDLASVLQRSEANNNMSVSSLRCNLLQRQRTSSRSVLHTPDIDEGREMQLIDYDLHQKEMHMDTDHHDKEIEERDDEIKRLKLENKMLLDAHLEIQGLLKARLKKKQKRIDSLKQQNQSLQMRLSKQSCNLIPWCST